MDMDKLTLEEHKEWQEMQRKAKAFDYLYASFDKGDKDLSLSDFDEAMKRYEED